jgi:hypothetical protein
MANGDISSVKTLGSFTIGGGGHNTSGVAQNAKVATWGQITGTWADTTGLLLDAKGGISALGLASCDVIKFDVVSVNGVFSIEEAMWTGHAIRTSGGDISGVLVQVDMGAGTGNPTAGHVCVVNFFAVGNSNAAPSLT